MNNDEFYGAVVRILDAPPYNYHPDMLPTYDYVAETRDKTPTPTPELWCEWYTN